MRQQWADYRMFWRQFREKYQSTGAVLPSGRALSAALARYVRDGIDVAVSRRASEVAVSASLPYGGRRILEVGPGTGAVTAQIVHGMRPDDRLVLVERNDAFVACLRRRLAEEPEAREKGVRHLLPERSEGCSTQTVPDTFFSGRITLVHAAVEDLPEDIPFDLIISGLPLNNFPAESVEQIFAKLRRLLAPNGVLSFFEYVAIRRVKSVVSRRGERQRLRNISRVFGEVLGSHEVGRDLVLANVPPAWVHHVRFDGVV